MKTNIQDFRGIHDGATIAILGSSPTIQLYNGREDVAIAVNGASICDTIKEYGADYFVCGDKMSPWRAWFGGSRETCRSRLLAPFVAPYDSQVIPDESERTVLASQLEENVFHQEEKGGDIGFSPDFTRIAVPHGVFVYSELWDQKIHKGQEKFCRGGTISGVAAQIALVMGAKEVHLYGCSFGKPDPSGRHYGYDNGNEPGGIDSFHPIKMDYILSRLVEEGVDVFSHGFTNLRVPKNTDQKVFSQ
ncbi:MAG: hypothetical protein NUV97_01695 [archaeon]|nr:hypothetical protein [archaeon]MCR4323667.1 hypothetical protein [Nanoarchaeota archaeon]